MAIDSIDRIIEKYEKEPGSLIQVLLDIQEENSWLSIDALRLISQKLNIPLQQVRHAATFYKAFSIVPQGRHRINVCTGTACHVRGADRVLDSVKQATALSPGQTDRTLKFSLKTVNCLGCCALGPVVEIDGKTCGKMTPAAVTEILKNYE